MLQLVSSTEQEPEHVSTELITELHQRMAKADAALVEDELRYRNRFDHITQFVLGFKFLTETEKKIMINLAYVSSLPMCKGVYIPLVKTFICTNHSSINQRRKWPMLKAIAVARGYLEHMESLATNEDWQMWIEQL